eukprot:gnl/Dysnectes_brevis/1428_a1617_1470.p1 GENE.gnl/Dysnectes_brevis/1428_a1617_1470~~gnl/Dysnectes_brevis/1428_a1617_1470.p1  ORF type:complete len:977 (+),score=165.12 gnl/Dysnectes_brevis/1428_a1617_1470:43-2931(+)
MTITPKKITKKLIDAMLTKKSYDGLLKLLLNSSMNPSKPEKFVTRILKLSSILASQRRGYEAYHLLAMTLRSFTHLSTPQRIYLQQEQTRVRSSVGSTASNHHLIPVQSQTSSNSYLVPMPPAFSWAVPGWVALSAGPLAVEQAVALKGVGVELAVVDKHSIKACQEALLSTHILSTLAGLDNAVEAVERQLRMGRAVAVCGDNGCGLSASVVLSLIGLHDVGILTPTPVPRSTWEGVAPALVRRSSPHLCAEDSASALNTKRGAAVPQVSTDAQAHCQALLDRWQQQADRLRSSGTLDPTSSKFPRIPHLPTSGSRTLDDLVRTPALDGEWVISEKLDGANCCIVGGRVYARSHSQTASGPAWAAASQLAGSRLAPMAAALGLPSHLHIYGENMEAQHGIAYSDKAYGSLTSPLYVLSVLDTRRRVFLSWDEQSALCQLLDLPMPPMLHRGAVDGSLLASLCTPRPSSVGAPLAEGLVMRPAGPIPAEHYTDRCAKWVRPGLVRGVPSTPPVLNTIVLPFTAPDDADALAESEASTAAAVKAKKRSSKKSKKKSSPSLPRLLVLCGMPACGKSSFAGQMAKIGWHHVCQDECGSRDAFENAIGSAARRLTHTPLIADRCNASSDDRKLVLSLAFNPKASLVWFDLPLRLCQDRAVRRVGHPTLGDMSRRGRETVVASHARKMQTPDLSEGWERIYHITSQTEANELLRTWGAEPWSPEFPPVKFPRTRHLLDAREFSSDPSRTPCAVSRDDLLLAPGERKAWLDVPLWIEEKVDGANIGFSLVGDEIRVQNRAHYVPLGAPARQFKLLPAWIAQHEEDLRMLLQNGRYLLFGEWLAVRHGVHYTDLPGRFLAFDLYDQDSGRWLSRPRFWERMCVTSVPVVQPLLSTAVTLRQTRDLSELLERTSSFGPGLVEGLYIRRDDGDYLDARVKIVSSHFTEQLGEGRWETRELVMNGVKDSHSQ